MVTVKLMSKELKPTLRKNNLGWAQYLVYVDNKRYGPGLLDLDQPHEDFTKGIHISLPQNIKIIIDSEFEYHGKKMKALTVHPCPYWKNSMYVFAREVV